VTRHPHVTATITVEYDDSGRVRRRLESEDLAFEAAYEAAVTFTVDIPEPAVDDVLDGVRSATSGRATIDLDDFRSETL